MLDTPQETEVLNAVTNCIEKAERRKRQDLLHLKDPDYVRDCEHLTMDEALELFERKDGYDLDKWQLTCGVLELYYCFRNTTEANRESLLAAGTFAVMHRLGNVGYLKRSDVASEYGVSEDVISKYNLDMLEHRWPEDNDSVRRRVMYIVDTYRKDSDAGDNEENPSPNSLEELKE